jgi:hypothetical protein
MPTLMPRDDDAQPIPALRLRPGGAQTIAATTAASARTAVAFAVETRIIGLCATGPVFVQTGGADVTAATTDHYLPAGLYYDVSLGDARQGRHTHVAAIAAETGCMVHVSEKE